MSNQRPLLKFVGIGFEAVGLIILAVWVGDSLDRHLDGRGLWMGVCVLLALTAWLTHIMLLTRSLRENSKD